MPESAIADLHDALLALESQLQSLQSVESQLAEAHHRLDQASETLAKETETLRATLESETADQRAAWAVLAASHAKAASDLAKSVKAATNSAAVAASQAVTVAEAIRPLGRAIAEVRFPERLDKIDLATSTLANTFASSHADTGRRFDLVQAQATEASTAQRKAMDEARSVLRVQRRGQRAIIAITLLNTLLLAAAALFHFRPWRYISSLDSDRASAPHPTPAMPSSIPPPSETPVVADVDARGVGVSPENKN